MQSIKQSMLRLRKGVAKFGGKKPNKAAIKLPLRDGDIERDDEAYKGHYFINANSTTAPQIVDRAVKPILDRSTRKLPMTEDVFRMFRAILEDRPTDFPEIMVDGYVGFLFRDKNGMPEVALHWEHRLKNAVNRYNSIFRVQLPKITPHICRHTYCSNQAKAGMNPKTLQYLMGHSDIGVTMNTYTHLGLDDAKNEMIRMEELEQARKEVDKAEDKKPMKQNMFKVV